MNIFNKIRNKIDKSYIPTLDWNDVTLEKFYKIQDLIKEQDEYTSLNLIDTLYNINSVELPATELAKYINKLGFLNTELPKVLPKKQYTINGTKYDSNYGLPSMTTGQFIDYQNYLKAGGKFEDLLSVFFTPESHKYNDGYDINKVKSDILQLSIVDVSALAFFFERQLQMFCNHFQHYLIQKLKKQGVSKEAIDQVRKVDFYSLVSYPTSLLTAAQRMNALQTRLNNQ